jgi:uncharacterized protein (DUF1330 family)
MSVYIMASIAVEDWNEYGKYQEGFLDVFVKYKGEILAVSDEPEVIEGEWPFTRAVLLKFPTREDARSWYESPAYQAIAKHRWSASRASIVAVEGFE